jgi:hypothetical protein
MNKTNNNVAASRKFKSLLVALLIASQLVTTVYALPVPQPNQAPPPPPEEDEFKEKHESAAQKAYRAHECASHPASCLEDAALNKVHHLDKALTNGIERTAQRVGHFEEGLHSKVQSVDEFKDALLHGKDPSKKDDNMVKRDYMPTLVDLPVHLINGDHARCSSATACDPLARQPYQVVLLPVNGQYEYDAPPLNTLSEDLLESRPFRHEEEYELVKRSPKAGVAMGIAQLTLASVGLVGGAAYLAGLAKDKAMGHKHHRHNDDRYRRNGRDDDRRKRSIEESLETVSV